MICLYETLCLISSQITPEEKEGKKTELIQKIKSIIAPENLEVKNLKEENLFYKVNKDDYLLLNLKANPQNIGKIEHALKDSPFISQYLLINLDKEPKIKQRSFRRKESSETGRNKEENRRKRFN